MKREIIANTTMKEIIVVTQSESEYIFHVQANTHATYCFVMMDSAAIDCTVKLNGSGAHIKLYGMYLLNAEQKIQITTRQEHGVAHGTSSILIKGVLTGNAQFEHKGLIAIEKKAVGSTAYQHTKNIILSPTARAWAQPSLEVLTHEVHCAHGSATGYLDEDQLYYMRSRGISPEVAKTLLLKGFFADILQEVGDCHVAEIIDKKIDEQV